jgi:hypothetical protein
MVAIVAAAWILSSFFERVEGVLPNRERQKDDSSYQRDAQNVEIWRFFDLIFQIQSILTA